ncbi:MAG: hypothetical protein RBU25_16470 [Lentisphaeria bacterium]|jgi:hypothetical protein|nr:hypothetical protein [Lentisphaeria bacterium]
MLRPLLPALVACLLLPVLAAGDPARDLAVRRREQQAGELHRLFAYRRDRRIPTAGAAEGAIAAAQTATDRLGQAADLDDPAAFARILAATDEQLAAARAVLDQHWPDGLVMRTGVGGSSFGRYGWRQRFGGLVWDLAAWDRLASPAEASPVRLAPPGATLAEERPATVSWTCARHQGTLQTAAGTRFWNVTESILAPGILVETDAGAIAIARGDEETRGPDRILVPVLDTALALHRQSESELPTPADNWLLLCWESKPGEPPVLLVFEQIPERIEWNETGLVVHFAGGAGKIAVGSYHGIAEWSPDTSRGWQAVPRSVLRRCRELAALLANFPVGIEELYAVDEARGEVEIMNLLQTVPFAFAGRLPKQPATPLPPALANAVMAKVPIALPPFVQDWELATRAGGYRLSAGASLRFRLPILRFDHPVAPAPAAAPAAALELPAAPDTLDFCRLFPGWPGLAPADRERLAQTARSHLAGELARVADGQAHTTEPNSRIQYCDLDRQGSGATLRRSALLLDATYRYAKYSGDWDFVRTHAAALAELLEVQTALTDWALLAPVPGDALAADALPDALRGALAMSQMAEAVQDREALRRSRYLAARLLVPHTAGFRAQSSAPANRWTETGLPAAWDGVPFPETLARAAGNPVLPELLDAGLTLCRLEVMDWLRTTLPRHHPDWTGQEPAAAAEFWLLRHHLALAPEADESRAALAARLGPRHPARRRLAFPPADDAPVRLAEWQPAALGAFLYDPASRTARLELAGTTALRCTATEEPREIRRGGTPLPRSAWSYSREQERLLLRLGDGPHNLEILIAPLPKREPGPPS